MKCPKCNKEITDEAKFCSECGHELINRQREKKEEKTWYENYRNYKNTVKKDIPIKNKLNTKILIPIGVVFVAIVMIFLMKSFFSESIDQAFSEGKYDDVVKIYEKKREIQDNNQGIKVAIAYNKTGKNFSNSEQILNIINDYSNSLKTIKDPTSLELYFQFLDSCLDVERFYYPIAICSIEPEYCALPKEMAENMEKFVEHIVNMGTDAILNFLKTAMNEGIDINSLFSNEEYKDKLLKILGDLGTDALSAAGIDNHHLLGMGKAILDSVTEKSSSDNQRRVTFKNPIKNNPSMDKAKEYVSPNSQYLEGLTHKNDDNSHYSENAKVTEQSYNNPDTTREHNTIYGEDSDKSSIVPDKPIVLEHGRKYKPNSKVEKVLEGSYMGEIKFPKYTYPISVKIIKITDDKYDFYLDVTTENGVISYHTNAYYRPRITNKKMYIDKAVEVQDANKGGWERDLHSPLGYEFIVDPETFAIESVENKGLYFVKS